MNMEECEPTVSIVMDIDGVEKTLTKIQKRKLGKPDANGVRTVALTNTYEINCVPKREADVKEFIKNEVETINSQGLNNLYISNLMRKIESNFAYVDHMRFKTINHYDANYQAVKNFTTDLDELTVTERREYVPEFLVIEPEDIIINEYFSS
jgi:hypothetical protein